PGRRPRASPWPRPRSAPQRSRREKGHLPHLRRPRNRQEPERRLCRPARGHRRRRQEDILVVDTHPVVWDPNPTWKRRTILEGQTERDNVCIDAHDIDGDGKIDLALGAGWRPFNTKSGGTLQWLKQGKSIDEPWKLHPIGEEPTLHRIRFADIDGK